MRVGLDVGSTTIKCVVLDDQNNLLYSTYERHYSHIVEKSAELLRRVAERFGPKAIFAVSGSAGMGIASKGYSTFSFTFKAAGTDTCIEYRVKDAAAGYIDPAVLKETVVVKAGETKTFTFDCSNSQGIGLAIKENGTIGVFSEGWITNITLS